MPGRPGIGCGQAANFETRPSLVAIAGPKEVWQHIRPGGQLTVERDRFGDRQVCVSVERECAWEPEHGLQVVFRGGHEVTKVGPVDGHLTNAAAYARNDVDDLVYQRCR
jgi:hypothetical protein